jgi:hypothetical protein
MGIACLQELADGDRGMKEGDVGGATSANTRPLPTATRWSDDTASGSWPILPSLHVPRLMTASQLPEIVRDFVRRYLDSVAQLEGLLLLYSEEGP